MGMIYLGLRNLLRHKMRLALTIILISVPFFLLLVMQTIESAVANQTETLQRDVNTLIQLRARGSMGHVNMIGSDRLLPPDVLEKAKRIEHVVHVEPYLLAMAPVTEPNFVMHVGLAPSAVKRLESHGEAGSPKLIAGRDFTPDDAGKNVAIIGKGYAEWARITHDDIQTGRAKLIIDPTRSHPAIYPLDLPKREMQIIGMYASGYIFGDMQLFMPIDTFRSIYNIRGGVSWVFVRVDSAANVGPVAKRLEETVGDVADILSPGHAAEFTATTSNTVSRLTRVGTVLAVALMVIVVFFVTLLQVRERSREIGTLKAIGGSNGAVTTQFLTEAVALTVLGSLVGTLLFSLVGAGLTGRFFSVAIGPFLPSHYGPLLESLTLNTGMSVSAFGLVLLVALIAGTVGAAYGVWQILKLSPLEAMKYE